MSNMIPSKSAPDTFLSALTCISPAATALVGSLLLSSLACFHPLPAHADGAQVVAQIQGSGLVFKDTLQIERFEDPKVKGVILYVSNFQIPLTERIGSGKFFSDPSSASITCAKTGPIALADNLNTSPGGEPVFSENKSLFFKSVRVQRVLDEPSNTLIYVSFNTRLDKNDDSNKSRFQSSICAIPLYESGGASSATTAAATTAAPAKVAP
jgi:catabolite regulation protein CreA